MKETYIKQAVEYAKELLAIPSPTGYTAEATKYLMKTLQDMVTTPLKPQKVLFRYVWEGREPTVYYWHPMWIHWGPWFVL